MIRFSNAPSGRHFLQIPGPTNVPDRILRAIDHPTIDHRGPEFGALGRKVLSEIKTVFKTSQDVVIYPASGTGAWEAALVNTLSPDDRVLMFETGHFASLWRELAERLGLQVDFVAGDWRHGVDPAVVEARLAEDRGHAIKAIMVVHNETSTGVTSRIGAIRQAIDTTAHPALFMVDTISSLASIDYRHDEWGVDVTVAGSQKGLMLPPGLSFNAISAKALASHKTARLPRSYWDWAPMLVANKTGYFPYTPATNLLYGLHEALEMLMEEGLDNVFARHDRHLVDRATALDPNMAWAWLWSAWTRVWLGEHEAAKDHVARALRLSPFDSHRSSMFAAMASAHFLAGSYDEALAWAERAAQERRGVLFSLVLTTAAAVLAGKLDRAQEALHQLRSYHPDFSISMQRFMFPFRRPQDIAKFREGLRKAGFPE